MKKTVAETLEKTKLNLVNNDEEPESLVEPESGEPAAKKAAAAAAEVTQESENESGKFSCLGDSYNASILDEDIYENDYQQLHGFDDDEGMIDQEEDGLDDDYSWFQFQLLK